MNRVRSRHRLAIPGQTLGPRAIKTQPLGKVWKGKKGSIIGFAVLDVVDGTTWNFRGKLANIR